MRKALLISLLIMSANADCFWRERIGNRSFMSDKYNITYVCLSGYLFVNAAWQGNTLGEARADGLTQVTEIVDGKMMPKKCSCSDTPKSK